MFRFNHQSGWYVPGTLYGRASRGENPGDAVSTNFDWFDLARRASVGAIWTEDWMPDGDDFRWSYYASMMRSAVALTPKRRSPNEFSGYIVPRSSGQRQAGTLQRIVSLVANGAKGLKYFIFGPEYRFPDNCYSELANYSRVVREMAQGHAMIARVEDTLMRAARPAAAVAIVMPRSAEPYDGWMEDLATFGRNESLGGVVSLAAS